MEKNKQILSSKEENRYYALIEQFSRFITIKSDEIYLAMKDSVYSKEYAVQRVKEWFDEAMNNEKEIFIGQLEAEISEEKDLNKVLNEKVFELDQELAASNLEIDKLRDKLDKAVEEARGLASERESLEKSVNELQEFNKQSTVKYQEAASGQIRKVFDELEMAKSQTQKFKKEFESLQRDHSVTKIKEKEFLKDHEDLVSHIRKLTSEKSCLEREIEDLSAQNYEYKQRASDISSETEVLQSKISALEANLFSELQKHDSETEALLSTFKEKSRKFKSKILLQRKKLEDNFNFTESLKHSFSSQVNNLEFQLKEKNLIISDLQNLIEKQGSSSQRLETDKRQLEQVFNSKLTEMQKEVEVQVKRCQDYEKEVKALTETRLKSLEVRNLELESTREELRAQLSSALDSLETLRNAYSDQLNSYNEVCHENNQLKLMADGLDDRLKNALKQMKALEDDLANEQRKVSELFQIKCELEEQVKRTEECEWQTRQELEQTRKSMKHVEANWENTLRESRSSLRDGQRELLDRVKDAEKYSEGLKILLKTEREKNLKIRNLANRVKSFKHLLRDLKSGYLSSIMSLEDSIHNLFEKLTTKLIEKNSETRKLRLNHDELKKENQSLTKSVALCSKEMDALSQELSEKQKYFKDNFRQVKKSLKEKFSSKIFSLESNLIELNREKNKSIAEAHNKIRLLQEEISIIQSQQHEANELGKKTQRYQEDMKVQERRILELETFLEAERKQKEQLASLKNKEIEELKNKMKTSTRF